MPWLRYSFLTANIRTLDSTSEDKIPKRKPTIRPMSSTTRNPFGQ